MSDLNKWLNSKVSDNTLDKYTIDEYSLKPYDSKYGEYCYYTKDDSDMQMNDEIQQCDNDNVYNDHIFLYPNTNRYHVNYLFRQLVDLSYDNNFNYKIYSKNGKNIEYEYYNLMDVSFKESFYQFCCDNSLKSFKD